MIRVCAQLSFNIWTVTGVKLDNEHWCKHVPKSVAASYGSEVTILWNIKVNPDRNIPNIKPEIIIRDNEEETDLSTDAAADTGNIIMIKKGAEKILKYEEI